MIKSTVTARTKTNSRTQTAVSTDTGSRGAVMVTGFAATAVGVWAAACFVSAIVSSGPIGMLQGWFSAVSGM